tara:strand:+ start:190 stop:459 length:270 start_codon:yes stop_codon:yes gene_type:complete
MTNFKIDTKKKTLNYNLEFKFLGDVEKSKINLIKLQNEDLIYNGKAFDFIIRLEILPSAMLGVVVYTIDMNRIVSFSLPQLDIKFTEDE